LLILREHEMLQLAINDKIKNQIIKDLKRIGCSLLLSIVRLSNFFN
jgi:hypothetical protein